MTQRAFIAALVAAVLLTGVAVTVVAQPFGGAQGPAAGMQRGRGPGGPGPFGGSMGGPGALGFPGLGQADPTDAQKEQIRNIRESHKDEVRQIAERTRTAQQELAEASSGTTVDEAAIRAKSTALAAALADGAILRARVDAEIFNLLTPEQQAKVTEFRAEMQQRMQDRMQKRMKQGPPRRHGQ